MECPFLSTYEAKIECFKECVFYNYSENGGVCPFKCLTNYDDNKFEDYELYSLIDKEYGFLKGSYSERESKYL